jgi:hypothetical protein
MLYKMLNTALMHNIKLSQRLVRIYKKNYKINISLNFNVTHVF